MKGQRLLRAHHDGVGEAAQQHHQRQQRVHDADPLVVDAGDPFAPQIGKMSLHENPGQDPEDGEGDDAGRDHRDRLIEGNGRPTQFTEHRRLPIEERPAWLFVLRSRPRSYLLRRYGLKEIGIVEPIVGRRNLDALFGKLGIAAGIERRGRLACGLHPVREILCRDGVDLKIHVGKSVAAEVRGQAMKNPGRVSLQVKPGRHAVHRVDHAAELRDEKRIHDARRRQREMHRHANGHSERVDGCDLLLGIKEQPFPIERNNLDLERRMR